ncbi:hypothetical protein HPC49_31245 [Pyxidicoccus fallax]|uniref:Uncharacterized protein n=1 Tax=Pyxidicoccus fallax TaxID=394095 RepID=A0A848LVK0_9BACT|nr:FG-GAP repeat protein [Pyxidicoccus fallax]NMO21463.1 hypothetical protein [Pyxidicoccus fallax]NPC82687.1 hypothetical protein [Pyxidicoccus fallax]
MNRWLRGCALALMVAGPFAPALAAEPPAGAASCSKAEVTKRRRSAEKLYREGRFSEAVETLRRTKETCWSALDATDRGWLVSDLGLAALRAGQPEVCRQVLDEAPAELDAGSRVAKAIAHNRGLCQKGDALPVKVLYRWLGISDPSEASAALSRSWSYSIGLREGSLPGRRDRDIDRCTELDGVEWADLEDMKQIDIGPALSQRQRCWTMKRLTTARPSRVSYVRNVLSTKAPGTVLPSAMAPPTSYHDSAAPDGAGQSWAAFAPKLRFEPDPERPGEVRITGEYERGQLEPWAVGDFNGDGFEDIVIHRTMSYGGSLVEISTFLLTRTRPDDVLTVLEQMD